jgi:hypothetical protein
MMAIVIIDKTVCPICNQVIGDNQRVISFPPLVTNELDPLFLFHDAAIHEECFRRHPLANAATKHLQEMREKTAPVNRRCLVCTRLIVNPDDYFTLGHLVMAEDHALWPYNFAQFHRSCLPDWQDRTLVKNLLEELLSSGKWRGPALRWVLDGLTIADRQTGDRNRERSHSLSSP